MIQNPFFRRLITLAAVCTLWLLLTATLPAILLATVTWDALRHTSGAITRALLFFVLFLTAELAGIAASALLWLVTFGGQWVSQERWHQLHFGLQRIWSTAILRGALAIFGVKVVPEDFPSEMHGPSILLVRHASTADTVLAAALLAGPLRMNYRYVLKAELLWDPCLDIVGNRLPNAFVYRNADRTEDQLAAIRSLCLNLGPRDGVLIFPEGTRFSPSKRVRALDQLAASDLANSHPAVVENARKLTCTLPPKLAGLQTVLDEAPEADVAILGHTGFEGAATFREFFRGDLIGRTLKLKLWQYPRSSIPADVPTWIHQCWHELDTWTRENIDA